MFTVSVCSALVGRTVAVASLKILPSKSASTRIVTRARPRSISHLRDPPRGRARHADRRLLDGLQALGVGQHDVELERRAR